MSKKVISLFSGAGGMDIGFTQAGFEIAVAVEEDPSCCATLRANRPELNVIEGDVSSLTTEEVLKAAGVAPLEAALVIGGPPCQSFSLAGKRMGLNDKRGTLVLDFVRVVREALPVGFVMENVKGMLNWERGAAIDAVVNEFLDPIEYDGNLYQYEVTYKVLKASEHGVPQHRERLFIIGNRIGKGFDFPEPAEPSVSAWDAFGHLPPADEPSATAMRVSATIKGRIERHGY